MRKLKYRIKRGAVAYTADIEIAVRGARQLKDLQNQLLTTADTVSALDGNLRAVANQLPRSISNLKSLASQAAESFDKVALNTNEAIDAAKNYIKTTDELNKGLQERLDLINSIRATETATQRRVTPGDAGYGQQTPALPPSMVRLEEIKQNWNKFFLDAAETATDIQQQTAANKLNVKTSWAKFFDSAATLAEDLTAQIRATEAAASAAARKRLAATTNKVVDPRGKQAAEFPFGPQPLIGGASRFGAVSNEEIDAAMLRGMKRRREEFYAWEAKQPRTVYTAYDRNFFAPTINRFKDLVRAAETAGAQITKSIGKRLGGATIGGAFPLLFGQGPEAAIGGALGGLLFPAGGGFAGSLLGTLVGDLKSAQVEVTRLTESFGYNEVQARTLAKSFELAGKDADSLKTALTNVQGLGITSEEQISLLRVANELSAEYGGKVDKITQSLADTLEQGKVTVSSITNLTSQGIPVQEKLADKLGVTREELFKLARDGKVPVQELLDVMVDLGIEAENTSNKGKTGFDTFAQAAKDLGIAVANLAETLVKILAPAIQQILSLATRALTAVNGLLTSNITRQLGQAGFSFTFLLESQGIDNIASALNDLNKITPTTVDQTTSLLGNLDDMSRNLQRVRADGNNWVRATALQGQVMKEQNRILEQRKKLGGPVSEQPIGRINAPLQLTPRERAGSTNADREAEREAERVAEALIQQRAVTLEIQRQSEFSAKIAAAELAKDPVKVRELQGAQELAELGVQTAKQLELEKNTSVQLAIAKSAQARADLIRQKTAQDIAQIEQRRKEQFQDTLAGLEYQLEYEEATTREKRNQLELEEAIRKAKGQGFTKDEQQQIAAVTERLQEQQRPIRQYMKQLEDSLNDTEGQIVQLTQTIETELGSAMSNAITGLVTGTQTVEEAFSQMFANIGKAFIDMATQLLAQQLILTILKSIMGPTPGGGGLFGFGMGDTLAGEGIFTGGGPFQFRAEGGPVSAGQPYVVGEKGPELFVPGSSGNVVPNDMFEATRSAIGGGGGGSAAFDENREALNSVTTLNRERQVERLLTSGATSTEIRYSRVGSGDLPFVTEEDMLQATRVAAQEGARLGQARTMAALKNNPGSRRSIGI